jgi:hypothetical protein
MQTIEKSVLDAVNSRADAVLDGWSAPAKEIGLQGRKPRRFEANSATFGEV